jgi:hypothetical protein
VKLPLQVAFFTGQSDPERCALSGEQAAFLDALPIRDAAKIRRNFPYEDDTLAYRDVSLLAAGWHNARQYLMSRTPAFAERHRPAVLRLLAQADSSLLLAGSCGLELLANLSLPGDVLGRVHVFAYGPVVRSRPACDICAVRGRGDWIARLWGGPADHIVDGGHMAYLRNPDVLALCQAQVARLEAGAGAPVL